MLISQLKIDQPYRELFSDQYFFTPDGVGVIWQELEEIRQTFPYTGIIDIEELED